MINTTSYEFYLPAIMEDEKLNYEVTVSLIDDKPIPKHIRLNDGKFTVNDPPKSEIYAIKVCLDDNYSKENCYRFKLTIQIFKGDTESAKLAI